MIRRGRRIIAEEPDWNLALVPNLSALCLECMLNNFEAFVEIPIFEEMPPPQIDFFLRRLSTSLPVDVTANVVPDGIYWKRCCEHRWGICDVSDYSNSWKRMFFERHLASTIELFIPDVTDPKTILDLVTLCTSYVKRLDITQLLVPIKEPVKEMEKEVVEEEEEEDDLDDSHLDLEIKIEKLKTDHFDFGIILDQLTNLEELHLAYRIKQCGMNFEWYMFEMTDHDCELLAKALMSCQTLRILRLRDSNIDDKTCRVLVKSLLDHPSLKELDFAYNLIGYNGARAISKILSLNKLETLNMCYNKIGSEGAKAIAHGLSRNSTLLSLNLRLNTLTDEGAQAIIKALTNNKALQHLHLGGTGVTWPTAVALSKLLVENETLRSINLSCNYLGDTGGKALKEAMAGNSCITECDLRQTEVDTLTLYFINNKVKTNYNSEKKKQLENENLR